MKKDLTIAICLSALTIYLVSCTSPSQRYLNKFFKNQDYNLQSRSDFDETFYYACQYIWSEENIIEKAIVYRLNGKEVEPVITFDTDKVTNGSSVIYDNNMDIYGWTIHIGQLNDLNKPFIRTQYYINEGKEVKNGPSFLLDDNGKFEYNAPEWSAS